MPNPASTAPVAPLIGPNSREADVALVALRAAAEVCMQVRAGFDPGRLEKSDRSPVTIADFAAQAVVCSALRAAFPEDPIVAEEDSAELAGPERAEFLARIGRELDACAPARALLGAGPRGLTGDEVRAAVDHGRHLPNRGRFWTLDPIDGTKGFLRGGQYAVSLALLVDGRLQLGGLACPALGLLGTDGKVPGDRAADAHPGRLFLAVRGDGSWAVDWSDPARRSRLHVSPTADPRATRWCESVESGHSAQDVSAAVAARLGIVRPSVRLDSQAKYAVVATGAAEAYLRLPVKAGYREKIWDHAGGVLLVEEAGGRVTDVEGRDLDWTRGAELSANRGVIVTNGACHAPLLAALREVH